MQRYKRTVTVLSTHKGIRIQFIKCFNCLYDNYTNECIIHSTWKSTVICDLLIRTCVPLTNEIALVVSCRKLQEQVNEFAHIQLEDLTVIKTLGVGGFGRVELVNLLIN